MNYAILQHTPNLDNVRELVRQTSSNNIEQECNDNKKKIRIHDDPGELVRYKNKLARKRTNEVFNDAYFNQFH